MPRFNEYTTPDCCPEIKKSRAVFLSADYECDHAEGQPPRQEWISRAPSHDESFEFPHLNTIVRPKFCPHCGKPLPKIVPRETDSKKIRRISDGGYYCDTCTRRLNECTCYPITAAFQAEQSDEDYEIYLIATLISLAPGYAVDLFGGMLQVCRLESGKFAVIHPGAGGAVIIGEDPHLTAIKFLSIRRQKKLGYDFETTKRPTR